MLRNADESFKQEEYSPLLPPEVWIGIFAYTSPRELLSLMLVCKHFHQLIVTEQSLWKLRYRSMFPLAFAQIQTYSERQNYLALMQSTTFFKCKTRLANGKRKRTADNTHETIFENITGTTPLIKASRNAEENATELSPELKLDFELLYQLLLSKHTEEIKTRIAQLKNTNDNYINVLMLLPYHFFKGSHRRYSLLHVAIETGNAEVVKLLLAECSGITLKQLFRQTKYYDSLFHCALKTDQYEIASLLLKHEKYNAYVNQLINSPERDNPLFLAIDQGDVRMLTYLISDAEIDINQPLFYTRPPQITALGHPILLRDTIQITPLLYAINQGQEELVDILMGAAADLTATDNFGNNALHHAVWSKNPTLVQMLNADDFQTPNQNNQTPLQLACSLGYTYTRLFSHPNLTNEDYKNIFLQDWQIAKIKQDRLKDVYALLQDRNIFKEMENNKDVLNNLIGEMQTQLTVSHQYTPLKRKILDRLNQLLRELSIQRNNFFQPAETANQFSNTNLAKRHGI